MKLQTKRCLQHLAAKAGASCGLHLDSASAVDKQSQFAEKQTYKMFMLKSTHVCWKALMYAEKHSFISLPICWGPLWETCTDRSKPNTFNIVKRADARVPVVCLGDGCIFFWAQQRINSFKRKKWVEVGPQPDWVTEQAKLHSQVKKKSDCKLFASTRPEERLALWVKQCNVKSMTPFANLGTNH